jgi:hypothetical protein
MDAIAVLVTEVIVENIKEKTPIEGADFMDSKAKVAVFATGFLKNLLSVLTQ